MSYKTFFKSATGFAPYPYQNRLAEAELFPEVLSVPTGVGKTAAVILAWMYRRHQDENDSQTPRRLIYCLPMRTLVEQTRDVAENWRDQLQQAGLLKRPVNLHVLMGGEEDSRWYASPEKDAILIGTQDMLLSRALNRGYGMSRYRWPIDFSLVNNDCLWVLDETQLMGVGLTTSAQLQGLREKLQTYGNCQTLWMSATLNPDPLNTVDHPLPETEKWRSEQIEVDDRDDERVENLLTASKPLQPASLAVPTDSASRKKYPQHLAEQVLQAHQAGTLTLVVLNRVDRAQETFRQLQKQTEKENGLEIKLIHSRFRPHERERIQSEALNEQSIPPAGRILVATQAIEAGVDISATTLFTELAPWSSLVQRFGRCNRKGKCGTKNHPSAQIFWIDLDTENARQAAPIALPYTIEEMDRARDVIRNLTDVGPQSLPKVTEPEPIVHVLRRKDLIELFDTTPDLSGNDLDISRFIREDDDTSVQVYWRGWEIGESNRKREPPQPDPETFPAPDRQELCAVSITQFKEFISKTLKKNEKTKSLAWVWNPLENEWEECRNVRPGQFVLLHQQAGGYDTELGWTGEISDGPVKPCPSVKNAASLPAMDQEEPGAAITIQTHLNDVGTSALQLQQAEDAQWDTAIPWEEIIRAAWWHDVGKAHPAFQGAMQGANPDLPGDQMWAKSEKNGGYLQYKMIRDEQKISRRGFRHELASALAFLQQHAEDPAVNLIAYLIAAHHGKVRLSIRSLPNETKPKDGRLFARGLWDHDELPALEIGNGEVSEALQLELSVMQLGDSFNEAGQVSPSWLSRTLQLRDQFGPFRLAYLETLVRIADWRGSSKGDSQ
ncbi:CRISPR-associated helicase Cas3' [Rubinisphaera sp.]|uniref:type I-G CRISPR-associated helicase/endonuclease Cas3g n=1 Tax=Rubinisphaera sp. TaxID=2024857 RepID=UPI000C11E089|nr:CRISPR-associated helicase Cas3' [Rubinisphaera sp.]MBV10241.1 hypothetical protein [Rubinisphaera sp.]HCS54135.1 CRISPR-associated helicase/endonuclease Cas3 [Planctomycetaceae bacterium]|tara:strand:- start:5280 stop:7793 length:2514 start_codon:yes stop_codon:yes gene_type:complete